LIDYCHEQTLARREQDAGKGNVGTKDPMAQATSGALRLPGSSKESVALYQDQEMKIG
jgi:hypothetical protein